MNKAVIKKYIDNKKKCISGDNIKLYFKDDIKPHDIFHVSSIVKNNNGITKIELEKIRKYEG